jgi:biopolymer transport protein ExbD
LPKVSLQQAGDQAEAIEPVDLGMDWRRPGEEEDEDVDMIPLIDISLVLLIFFMMTASISTGILSTIATPSAQHQLAAITQGSYWVGVDSKNRAGIKGEDGATWYSCGKDIKEQVPPTQDFSEVSGALVKELEKAEAGEVKIRLRGDRNLPIETIKNVVIQLQDLESRLNRGRGSSKLTFVILGEVSEPKGSGQ